MTRSFHARLSLWISLLLVGLAQARPTLEQLRGFEAKLELRQREGDLRGILQQASEQPELSAILIHDWPLLTPQMTPERRQLLTLLERGVELRDKPPAEAALSLAAEPAVELGPRLEELDWFYWGVPVVNRLLDVGNLRQLAEVLEAFRAHSEELRPAEASGARFALALARLLAGDFPATAVKRQQLLDLAGGKSEDLSFAFATLGMVALDCGRAEVAAEMLEPLRDSLSATGPERQALYTFVLETLRYRLAVREQVEKDPVQLRQSHDRAWKALAGYQGGSLADMRLWMRCAHYWSGILNSEINFGDEALKAVQLQDFQELFRISQAALEKDSYGAQIGTLNGVLELELDNLWLGTRTVAQSRPLLELAGSTLKTYRGWMQEDQLRLEESCPPALRRRLGANFHLDFAHGDLDLLESRYLALRQLHSPSTDNVRDLIAASQASTRYHGLVGFGDPRYLLVLNGATPAAVAVPLIDSLEADWKACGYRPGLAALPLDRGRVLARAGRKQEAIEQLSAGLSSLERYLVDLGAGRLTLEAHRSDFSLLSALQAETGRAEEAFATMARFDSLEAVQRGARALWQRPDVARVRSLSEAGQGLEQLASWQRSLGVAADSQLLAENRQQFQRELDGLLEREPRYRRALSVMPANLAAAQQSLPAGTALVQYVPGPEGLYVLVVTRGSIKARRVAVARVELEKRVRSLRRRIAGFPMRPDLVKGFSWTDRAAPGYAQHTLPLLEDSRRLYDWLLRPLEADLKGCSVLAIVPSGNLYYLPFAGLIRGMGPKGPEFVAQRWQCVELLKAADLRELGSAGATRGGLLALANPDGSLPGAEREVRLISKYFPGASVYFGAQALSELLQRLPAGVGYVHLATHGILNGRDPLASYLVVAGSRLHIRDIYGLSFKNLRLVTLSACQTAMQERDVSGGEVTSLAQAFSVAGGRAVLASLWDVSDEGTERLMSAFYPKVAAGGSLSRALQQAQLEVMAQPQLKHPFYWASFSLYGDWR